MARTPFIEALHASIPTFFAYFPLSIVFGILFTSHMDLPWIFAPLMSVITFAGAIQFVALGIFAVKGSILGLFITATFIGLRNSFYGLSVLHQYEKVSLLPRQYLIFGLVDPVYSIVQHRGMRENDTPFLFYLTGLIHLYWGGGTFIGAYFGKHAFQIPGLEFSLTALFTVFFIEQWKKCKDIAIVIVALLGFSIGLLSFKEQAFTIGIIITFLYICLRYLIKERKS